MLLSKLQTIQRSSIAEFVESMIEDVADGFRCLPCGKVSLSKSHARRHVRMVHMNTAEQEVACNLCGKKYRHKWSLDAHQRKMHIFKPTF